MASLVLGIIQEFLCQMYSFKYYTLEKYVLYLLSLFLIIYCFHFRFRLIVVLKTSISLKGCCILMNRYISYSKTIGCDPLLA